MLENVAFYLLAFGSGCVVGAELTRRWFRRQIARVIEEVEDQAHG
jgi:hypothetical protein